MRRTIRSAFLVTLALGLIGPLGPGSWGQVPASTPPDGPALAPPTDAPASTTPDQAIRPVPPVISTPLNSDRGPILALPGVARPRTPVAKPAETPPPLGDLPALADPVEMSPRPLPRQLSGGTSRTPLTLESEATDGSDPGRSKLKTDTSSSSSSSLDSTRRPGILGRILGPPSGTTRPLPTESDDEIELETRTDPAQIAALKRRIERQARDAVGDRARQVEVRVKGKDVHIRVSGTKLFQKRAVRSALERLPTSNGYRTIIDTID